MAEDTFGQITGRVVHAKTKTWEDGSRSLRVLVRSNDDKRTIGLSFGGDAFEPALKSLKSGRLACGAIVRVSGGRVKPQRDAKGKMVASTTQVLKDGRTTTLTEVRDAREVKTITPVAPLPPLVRRVTQFV